MITYISRLMGHAFKFWMFVASTGLLAGGFLSGCTDNIGYTSAFAGSTVLDGNSRLFIATTDQLFKAAKITLIQQQGFTSEYPEPVNGSIKGTGRLGPGAWDRALQTIGD